MTTALEYDILAQLEHQDLEVQALRVELHGRGHDVSTTGLYERLVHLEGEARVRVVAPRHGRNTWGAL